MANRRPTVVGSRGVIEDIHVEPTLRTKSYRRNKRVIRDFVITLIHRKGQCNPHVIVLGERSRSVPGEDQNTIQPLASDGLSTKSIMKVRHWTRQFAIVPRP